MMRQSQAAQRAPETRHPQTWVHLEETWLTPTWTQPPETASLAWKLLRYLYGLLKRNTEKRV